MKLIRALFVALALLAIAAGGTSAHDNLGGTVSTGTTVAAFPYIRVKSGADVPQSVFIDFPSGDHGWVLTGSSFLLAPGATREVPVSGTGTGPAVVAVHFSVPVTGGDATSVVIQAKLNPGNASGGPDIPIGPLGGLLAALLLALGTLRYLRRHIRWS